MVDPTTYIEMGKNFFASKNGIIALIAIIVAAMIYVYIKRIIKLVSGIVIGFLRSSISFSVLSFITPIIDKFVKANLDYYVYGFSTAAVITLLIGIYLKKKELDQFGGFK